jgi:hypothetical protein
MNTNAKTFDRREFFTAASAMALLSGVAITISGCGGSSGSPTSPNMSTPPPTPSSGGGDVGGSISDNHGHTAVVTRAQLTGGTNVNVDIRGSASHTHTVTLSQPDLTAIAAGTRVARESSNGDSHTHTVTFN